MIPFTFRNTFNSFKQIVTVEDYLCGYNDAGIWGETFHATRQIKAILLLLSMQDLQLLKEGEQSNSGLNITTDEELYFNDNRSPESNRIMMQSYVLYGGYRYRVVGTGIFEYNTKHKTYNALRSLQ